MSIDHSYEHDDQDYSRKSFPNSKREAEAERSKAVPGRRRKSPQSVNGIHKRRRRKMSW